MTVAQKFGRKSILVLIAFLIAGCFVIERQSPDLLPTMPNTTSSTIVIPTLTPYPTSTPPAWPTLSKEESLPSPLYFISSTQQEIDGKTAPTYQCAPSRLIRIEQDGQTRTLQTSCLIAGGVNGFDISPIDDSIIIAAYGGLWLDKNDGKGYQKIVEALPNAEGTGELDNISDPAWSPTGKKIAYADGGIRIFDITTGDRFDVVENRCSEMELNSAMSRCFYGNWFLAPQWSPTGDFIVYRSQNADYFFLDQYSLENNRESAVPGTAGVSENDIAWSKEEDYMLFDYSGEYGGGISTIHPSFIRMRSDDFSLEVLWDHSDRADPVFASNANNPWQVRYPFEASNGKIYFFQAEPCSINSCYDYALVEGTRTSDGFKTKIIRHDALPEGIVTLVWHNSGEYAALLIGSSDMDWYIAVMKISTGEIHLMAKEHGKIPLPIKWGK